MSFESPRVAAAQTSERTSGSGQPLLTFCVPTYNRSASVHRLVSSILARPDRDIEIVVLDNGSTDDTLAVLRAIVDPRLKVMSNGQNKGALFNMVNVFGHGTGRYLVYSTDQDRTDPDMIPAFKAFLSAHPEVSCGYCTFDSAPGVPNEFFSKGIDAVQAVAYRGAHPTGYFFRNADLRAVRLAERFSDFEVVDLFPLEFAFAEVAAKADGAIYNGRLFSPNTGSEVVTHKSSTTNGASKNAFFAPAARLKLAISFSRHIDQLPLPASDKSRLMAQVFMTELRGSTVGFKGVMSNEKLCIHYRMERREVTRSEMLRIGAAFCRGYFSALFGWRIGAALGLLGSLVRLVGARLARRLAGPSAAPSPSRD